LAGIGLLGSQKSPTVIAVAIPIVSLGLPVLDTTLPVARRFLRGQPIFTADRAHIHHRLLSLGHSPRRVALLLYSRARCSGLGGMLLVNDSAYVAVVLVVIGLGVGLALQRLRYYEFEELARRVTAGRAPAEEHRAQRSHPRSQPSRVGAHEPRSRVQRRSRRRSREDEFECAEVRLRHSSWGSGALMEYRRLD
jgi:UDP-GlcNAc:undecaprenyl-phosphate GlcNAc-1-phosphate transferase